MRKDKSYLQSPRFRRVLPFLFTFADSVITVCNERERGAVALATRDFDYFLRCFLIEAPLIWISFQMRRRSKVNMFSRPFNKSCYSASNKHGKKIMVGLWFFPSVFRIYWQPPVCDHWVCAKLFTWPKYFIYIFYFLTDMYQIRTLICCILTKATSLYLNKQKNICIEKKKSARAPHLPLVHANQQCSKIKMAAHSAVLSMSKIINPFWGGRLGNTVKVRQDTSQVTSVVNVVVWLQMKVLLFYYYFILSEDKVIGIIMLQLN